MLESLFAPLRDDPIITLVKDSFCRMDKTGNPVVVRVNIGIVLDLAAKYGSESICEMQIGELVHRQRPLSELSAMATMVVRAIVSRVPRAHLTGYSDVAADLEITHQLVRRKPPRKQTQQLFALGTGD